MHLHPTQLQAPPACVVHVDRPAAHARPQDLAAADACGATAAARTPPPGSALYLEPPAATPAPGPRPIAATNLAEARQLARAFAAVHIAPEAEDAEPLDHKKRFAYFHVSHAEATWFLKVPIGAAKPSPWPEPAWMAWAAHTGFGPLVHSNSGLGVYANVLASAWIEGDPLTNTTANTPHIRAAVLKQMHALHHMPPPADLVSPLPLTPPDYAGGAWSRLDDLDAAHMQTPLTTKYLRDLLAQVLLELEQTPTPQAICHRDTHPRNIFYNEGKAIFIDWDWSGWDDPLRDPARFFVLGGTPIAELAAAIEPYYGRPPTGAELRRLQCIMLATEIDFYGANQADTCPTHRSVTGRAERIAQLVEVLRPGA